MQLRVDEIKLVRLVRMNPTSIDCGDTKFTSKALAFACREMPHVDVRMPWRNRVGGTDIRSLCVVYDS